MYLRDIIKIVNDRIKEPHRFIQVLSGPRQVGKTTLAQQLLDSINIPNLYISADDPALKGPEWLESQWNTARQILAKHKTQNALLVVDEIHKIPRWSEVIKKLWDEDSYHKRDLRVLLLGSSPLMMEKGLTESLAGRFEIIKVPHWSYTEMRTAFNFDLDHHIYFGGYPGSAKLVGDEERWRSYIRDSLIETTISRDILLLTRVDKPALLRRLFELSCNYSGQILAYQKMVGQLQDAGNTTTLAHYLELLRTAGLVAGLQKYAGQVVRKRASQPKLQVFNTALISSGQSKSFSECKNDPALWGRFVESSVGAHIINSAQLSGFDTYYWREGDKEVDFVLEKGDKLIAIEVKSGLSRVNRSGLGSFIKTFKPDVTLIVGHDGIPVEEFLTTNVNELFR